MTRALTILVLAASLAAFSPAARSSAQDNDQESLITDAVAEYTAGRYAEAQALFRRAHALVPNARTLRGVGMASFEMREYVTALRALRASLTEEARPLSDSQREHVEGLIERASAFVGTYRFELEPADAALLIDGQPVAFEPDGTALIDAGAHTASAEHPDHRRAMVRLTVQGGTEQTVRMVLERLVPQTAEPAGPADPASEPASEPTSAPGPTATVSFGDDGLIVGGVVLLALGGLVGAASATTGILALASNNELASGCSYGVCPGTLEDEQQRTKSLAIATDVLWIGAAAMAVTGVILTVVGVASSSADSTTVSAGCSPRGCAVVLRGSL